ncbi:TetR/AcrR family transcriptional regulator [Agarilytica rhodophyticola]|uniref:TetR/AcrR family transcriptional regulator n=1 Tax=Agarilytica rhodophyticola TaxID=1737490 RepID=UPI000B342C3F|nr:TetR/AcrR family transcriptional regulator [Agarilytica rhodophyticola]
MPWEKSFDVETAISNAMVLFWQKGYAESSMAELLSVTGLSRGSLYNAFNGKRNLFVKSLHKYDEQERVSVLKELSEMESPLAAIRQFLDGILRRTAEDDDKKGCFLINTSLDLYAHDEETTLIVKNAIQELTSFFEIMITKGQALNEIPLSVDAASTANTMVGICAGIRVLGRGVFDIKALEGMADNAMKLLR